MQHPTGGRVRQPVFSAMSRLLAMLALLLMVFAALYGRNAQAEDDFLDPKVAFVFSAAMGAPDRVDVHFRIAKGYYMYRERFQFALAPEPARLGQPVYPHGIVKYDPTFDRNLEVYHNQITVSIPVKAGASQPLTLSVTGQGCADAGLCYPPMTSTVTLTPTAQGYALSGPGAVASVPAARDETPQASGAMSAPSPDAAGGRGLPGILGAAAQGSSAASSAGQNGAVPGIATGSTGSASSVLDIGDVDLASFLAGAGWLKVVGLCLLLGVLLTFTPCVLPMAPIVLAVVAGDARQRAGKSRLRGLALAAVYVLGVSVVYTVLGIAAGLAGAGLSAWLQTPWALSIFAVVLALLALSMFDVFTFQAPVGVQSSLNDKMARIPGGRFGGAFVMGMLSALIVGPCVAAPLAGVLLFISQTGNVVLGGSALFAMAWGQGVLLLVLGATSGALLPKAGPWMDGVKRLFGMLLLATAWWMVNPVLPVWVAIVGWSFLALCAALLMGAFAPWRVAGGEISSKRQAGLAAWRAVGLMLAFWAALQLLGLLAGGRDMLRPLAPFASTGAAAGAGNAVASASYKTAFTRVGSVEELDKLLAGTDKPVMLDFYADWCVSCIEMERFTFSDPGVAQLMSRMVLVQADVTKNTLADQALLKRFRLFGPPGIMFFDAKGKQMENLRVVGFKNARDFSAVLRKVVGGD